VIPLLAGKNVCKAYAGYPRWATAHALSVVVAAAMRLRRRILAVTYDVAEKSSLTLRQPLLTYTYWAQKQPMVVVNDAATSHS